MVLSVTTVRTRLLYQFPNQLSVLVHSLPGSRNRNGPSPTDQLSFIVYTNAGVCYPQQTMQAVTSS